MYVTLLQIITALIILIAVSIISERILRSHKKRHAKFTWRHYLFYVSFPLSVSAFIIYSYDNRLALVFVGSMVLGTVFEWLLGYYYHDIVGQKLWTYKKYAISGYTSWLAMPLWGFAGVLFAVASQLILG